jgi:FkbM family methyltransferase
MVELKTFVEGRPALWRAAWWLMHQTSWLLPHDPSYLVLKLLARPDGGLILDVGANDGISALSFRKLCPNYKIISFEPNGIHEGNLAAVCGRIKNAEFFMVGLGDSEGEFVLYTPYHGSKPLHTFSSLDKVSVQNALEQTYAPAVLSKIRIASQNCAIKTLDSFGLAPDIIKIDAEANELRILRGGADTLRRHKPALLLEACHGEFGAVEEFLMGLGYAFFVYERSTNSLRAVREGAELNGNSRNIIALAQSCGSQESVG